MWADSLPAEPQRKPKNTGVGSLSPLWGIFLTQESNYGLLHHKRILYQLSHQGCPFGVCSCILCLLIFLFYQLTFFNEKINIAIIPYQQIGNKRKKCLQSHPPKEKLLAFWYFLLVFFFLSIWVFLSVATVYLYAFISFQFTIL